MDFSLKERIDLLHDTNQISDEIYDRLPAILETVENFLEVKLSEENAGSFTSHISIALQRISVNNPLTDISGELQTVIDENPNFYLFAKELLSANNQNGEDIDAEAAYLTLYFGVLTKKENA
ncbi:PRD domain-containing protein [Actinomycetes bacterium NPDC127524]